MVGRLECQSCCWSSDSREALLLSFHFCLFLPGPCQTSAGLLRSGVQSDILFRHISNQDWQKLLNSASTHGSISIHNSAVLLKLCQNSMANLAYYWVKGAAYFNDNKLVFHRWWLDISAKAGFSVKACQRQLQNSWYITLNPSWNKFGCANVHRRLHKLHDKTSYMTS